MNPVDHDYLKHFRMGEKSLLIDIGASVGEWGAEILPQLKATGSLLVCMEPAPWCLGHLARWVNDEGYGHAMILSAAITSGENRVERLKIADSYLVSHLESLPGDPMGKWGNHAVRTDPVVGLTLMGLLESLGLPFVDMVKMDIEGAEVPVIMGAPDEAFHLIQNFTIAAYHDWEGQKTWEILQPFLESKGYRTIHECTPYREFPAMDLLYATKDGQF